MGLLPPPGPIQVHSYGGRSFLYCHDCHCVTIPSGLADHMQRLHKPMLSTLRRQVVKYYTSQTTPSSKDLITQHEQMAQLLPPNHSRPLTFLPIKDGFACGYGGCSFLSQSYKRLRVHLNEEHMVLGAACDPCIQCVSLQSWYFGNHKYAGYWIVASDSEGPSCAGNPSSYRGDNLKGRLEAQEQMRLTTLEQDQQQDHLAHSTNPTATETTPWLQHTQWPRQFAHRPLPIIAASAILPRQKSFRAAEVDYTLGVWEGSEFLSPAEDELRIRQLLRSLDSVFGRCLLTLETTPELFCCWLQSFNNMDFRPKPFTVLERTASQQRYISYWKQFLCFVFRAWRTERLLRSQIYGIQFSAAQEALLARVWALLGQHLGAAGCAQDGDPEAELDDALAGSGLESEDDLEEESLGQEWGWESESESEQQSELELGLGDELESEVKSEPRGKGQGQESDRDDNEPELGLELEGPGPYHELTERIFQLSCAFWTDLAKTGRTLDLPLVYFIGVLGIQRKGLNYRTAYLFTTRLAGLAWIGRLLMLEYALPQDAYGTLGWPGCSAFPDQLDRLQRIRRKYLCRGGRHAMAHTLELLFKGRSIAKKEGARANLSWSSSEQLLLY